MISVKRRYLTLLAIALTVIPLHAQLSPAQKALRFDVVSIRPSGQAPHPELRILPNGFHAIGMPVAATIVLAYLPAPYFKHFEDLKSIPSWVSNENYDIEAHVSPADIPAWQALNQNIMQTPTVLQAMLQALLADRFHLAIHSTPKMVDGYSLVLNKRKLRLQPDPGDAPPEAPGMKLLEGGRAVGSPLGDHYAWACTHTSITALLGFLSFNANGPLSDRTGLTGKYRFTLETFAPAPPGQDGATDPDRIVPFDIESLGLKLVHAKVPSATWVIDSIDHPSPN